MHLKVTVEEGREAELKRQPWDAQLLRALGFFWEAARAPRGRRRGGIALPGNTPREKRDSGRQPQGKAAAFLLRTDFCFPSSAPKVKRRSRAQPAAAPDVPQPRGFPGGFGGSPSAGAAPRAPDSGISAGAPRAAARIPRRFPFSPGFSPPNLPLLETYLRGVGSESGGGFAKRGNWRNVGVFGGEQEDLEVPALLAEVPAVPF